MASDRTTTFDVQAARARFPALANERQVFFDNAGGSQVLGSVADAVRDYLLAANVQLGASYGVARESTRRYAEGMRAAAAYVGAGEDEIGIRLPFRMR